MTNIQIGNLVFSTSADRAPIDRVIQQLRTDAQKQPLQLKLGIDEANARRSIDTTIRSLQTRTITLGVKLESTALTAELARIRGQSISLTVRMSGLANITNDVNTLRTLLANVGTNMQYRVTINTQALSLVGAQINAQITQLTALIAQLRALGGSGGPGGGGRGGGVSAANRTLLAELEALNNQWKRGDIGAAAFATQLTTLQARLRTAAASATAGTADFKALDTGLTKLTGSLRSINTDAFQKIRTEAGAMRAAFDTATAGVSRNSQQFRTAAATYTAESARITASLTALGASGTLTTQQLGQVNREMQRLAREQNTINGRVNHAGLSGSIINSFSGLPGAFGAAAGQGAMLANTFQSIYAAAGPVGIAVGVVTTAVGAAAVAANKAVNEYAKFEKGLAQVATLTDKTTSQLGEAGREVLKISMATGATFQELNAGLYDVLGAGVKGSEDMAASLRLLEQSAKLAKAGATETAVATDVLTSALNAYGLTANDAGLVSDKLFKAVDDGKMSFQQLSMSLGMVLPTAAKAGLSLDEVLASVAALTAQGIRPASAIEYLRSALANIIKPSEQAKDTAQGLGLQFDTQALKAKGLVGFLQDVTNKTNGNSESMSRLFGDIGGLTAITGLANGNFERLTDTLEGQAQAAGKTEEAYGKVAATLSAKSDEVAAKWKALWVGIGENFAPIKLNIMNDIGEMLDGFNQLIAKQNVARNQGNAAKDVGKIEGRISNAERERAEVARRIEQQKAQGNVLPYWTNKLTQIDATLATLRIELAQAKAAQAQARADAAEWGVNNATSNLAPGVQGPRLGGEASTAPVIVSGKDLVSLLGMAGRTTGAAYGTAYSFNKKDGGVFRGTHNGEDFFAPEGAPIMAPFTGQLSLGQDAKNGKWFEIVDALGNRIKGLHLSAFEKGLEAAVKAAGGKLLVGQGTRIGGVGDTGNLSEGNHLHLMAYQGGKIVNPLTARFQSVAQRPEFGVGSDGTLANTTTNTGGGGMGAVTAAQIVKAQALTAAIEKAKKALEADPKSVPMLQALSVAQRAAETWGKALATNDEALKLVSGNQGKLNKASGEYIATQKDLDTYGAKALRLIKAQDAAQASGNSARILAANNAIKLWEGESKAKAAVLQVEAGAYRTRQQAAERAAAEAKKKPELTDLQREQATQKERLAMEALEKAIRKTSAARLEAIAKGGVTEQVSLAKWEMARAELERRAQPEKERNLTPLQREQAAQKEAVAQEKLEKALRNTSAARLQEIVAGGVTSTVSLDKWKAADAEIKRRAEAIKTEEAKANTDSIARKREQQQIMAQANDQRRQLTVEGAQQSLARQEELNRQELAAFKGNARERLAEITQQAEEEAILRERVARAIRDKRLAEIKNDFKMPANLRRDQNTAAERVYQDTLLASEGTRAAIVRTATEGVKTEDQAVQTLISRYNSLRTALQDKAKTGTLGTEDMTAYARDLSEAWADAGRSGIKARPEIVKAHDAAKTFALMAADISAGAIQIAAESGAFDKIVDGGRDAAREAAKLQFTFEELRDLLPDTTQEAQAFVDAVGQLEKDGLVPVGTAQRLEAIAEMARDAVDAMAELKAAAIDAGVYDGADPLQNRDIDKPARMSMADLRGLTADPAAFIATWKATGASDVLPKLFKDSFTAESFADLGAPILQGLIDGLSTDPAWAEVVEAMYAGMALAMENSDAPPMLPGIVTGNERPDAEPTDWEKALSGQGRQKVVDGLRELGDEALAVQLAFAESVQDLDLYNAVLTEQKRRADDAKTALEGLPALLAQLDLNALERQHGAGGMDEEKYLAQRTALEERLELAKWEVEKKTLTGQALENAERSHQDRLAGIRAKGLADLRTHQKTVADENRKTQEQAIQDGVQAAEKFTDLQNRMAAAEREVRQASGETERPFQALIDRMEDMKLEAGANVAELDRLIRKMKELQGQAEKNNEIEEWADAIGQVSGALGGLGKAIGGDLGANIDGAMNAVQKGVGLAMDVMRIIANPADIQAWAGAITKLVTGIADAIGGFQKAKTEAAKLQKDFNESMQLINGDNYSKTFVKSRGFFADFFGGGPEVKQEIDKIGLMYAKSLESGFAGGMKKGMSDALAQNDFSLFQKGLRESVFAGLKDGMIDAFMNDTLLKGIIAPAIKAWSDALKTPGTEDDAAALAGIDAAISEVDRLGNRFYTDVAPKLKGVGDKWGIGADGTTGAPQGSLFGNAPGASLGIPRIELTLPASLTAPLGQFAGVVPVFNEASIRMLQAANLILSGGGNGGPPPLSGNGGLV